MTPHRTHRDSWLLWTNERALRLAGHRLGPNRMRRLRRQAAHMTRFMKGNVSNTEYRGMF